MDIQLGRSKTVRRAYGIDEIALVPGGRTVDLEVTNTSWSLGGITREIPIIASAMDGVVDVDMAMSTSTTPSMALAMIGISRVIPPRLQLVLVTSRSTVRPPGTRAISSIP